MCRGYFKESGKHYGSGFGRQNSVKLLDKDGAEIVKSHIEKENINLFKCKS